MDKKMKPYPTLSEMGVESPKQIDKYYITSLDLVDVLRIVYERPKNSFLPSSRTYKFPRLQGDAAIGEDGKKKTVVMETHPMLRTALSELQAILESRSCKECITSEILSEIELLEEDIAIRSECLKVLVGRIPAAD